MLQPLTAAMAAAASASMVAFASLDGTAGTFPLGVPVPRWFPFFVFAVGGVAWLVFAISHPLLISAMFSQP